MLKRIMKKRIVVMVLIAVFLSQLVAYADESPMLKFAIISDVHIDDLVVDGSHKNIDQCQTALNAAVQAGYGNMLIVGGDVSSYGNTDYWTTMKEMAISAGYENVQWVLGNHEYGTLIENLNADEDFLSFTGYENIYYTRVINGFHFIFLASEACDLSKVMGDTQIEWLHQKLDEAVSDAEGKPVFVVSHYNTTSKYVSPIEEYLNQYDNCFFFWGHTHDGDWDTYPISKYIRTSNRYTSSRMGAVQYGYSNAADIMLVDVFNDHVCFKLLRTDGSEVTPNTAKFYLCNNGKLSLVGNDTPILQITTTDACENAFAAFYDKDGKMLEIKEMAAFNGAGYLRTNLDIPENATVLKLFRMNARSPIGEPLAFYAETVL